MPCEKISTENGANLRNSEKVFLSNESDLLDDDLKENHPFCIPTREATLITKFNYSEKRKFSEVKRPKPESGSDSSSSDDEIKDICSRGVSKFRAGSSPPDKIAVLVTPSGSCHRKRNKTVSPRVQTIQRPSINFERMQHVSISEHVLIILLTEIAFCAWSAPFVCFYCLGGHTRQNFPVLCSRTGRARFSEFIWIFNGVSVVELYA